MLTPLVSAMVAVGTIAGLTFCALRNRRNGWRRQHPTEVSALQILTDTVLGQPSYKREFIDRPENAEPVVVRRVKVSAQKPTA